MKSDHYRRTTCRGCDSSSLEKAFTMVPTPVGDDYRKAADLEKRPQPIFFVEPYYCRDCSLIQLLGVVSPSLLYGQYIYETSVSLGLPDHFKSYAAQVIQRLQLAPDSLVIDIGCNDGTLLRAFREQKMKVAGVDPAVAIANRVKNTFDIDVEAAVLDRSVAKKISAQHGKAHLVTANNVVANIDDLKEFAASVSELLRPEGAFVLETAYPLEIARNSIFDNIYHEHLTYFTVKSLKKYFAKNGFELFDVERINTKGGSIRCYIQPQGGGRTVALSVQKLIDEEEAFGLYNGQALKKLGEKVASTKAELTELLMKLKNEGKQIAGYGASVGATTVIYEFGLEKFLTCIFDENPAKFDTFSPGNRIPVFSAKQIPEKKVDYIVILAWMYTSPIVAKNQDFLSRGGKFVSFLPQVGIL